jgi:hypothetical protein
MNVFAVDPGLNGAAVLDRAALSIASIYRRSAKELSGVSTPPISPT